MLSSARPVYLDPVAYVPVRPVEWWYDPENGVILCVLSDVPAPGSSDPASHEPRSRLLVEIPQVSLVRASTIKPGDVLESAQDLMASLEEQVLPDLPGKDLGNFVETPES